MPWEERNKMDLRIEFVIRAMQKNSNISQLCLEYEISRKTGYKWISRYNMANSVTGLSEKSRRPKSNPSKISPELEALILKTHNENFGLGGKKISQVLKRQGCSVSISTANRVLKRHGLVKQIETVSHATKQFEREKPNEMWQMDLKGPFKKHGIKCTPLTLIDDHSRFVTGLHALQRTTGENVKKCLISSFDKYGLPDSILTDHGSPWWSTSNSLGLTNLSVLLLKQGIKLHFCGFRHPQTQGKVERFHQTLKRGIMFEGEPKKWSEWQPLLNQFVTNYNTFRPHESLEDKPPTTRYVSSSKRYKPNPKEWEYKPEEGEVKKLSVHGCLSWNGRYYFVSEALAKERVQVQKLENKILVKYRNFYVREINLLACSTIPIVLHDDEIKVLPMS